MAALLALIIYEGWALWRAQQRTPEVVWLARTGELALADLTPERRRWLLAPAASTDARSET
jgi:hypothetical protein